MNLTEILIKIKKIWNWIWNSDSIWSWLVALILIFLIIKFIFFPTLSLIFGTSLPLAGVESSSMDHHSLKYCTKYDSNMNCIEQSSDYEICGKKFDKKTSFNFDEYWDICGGWYVDNKQITKPVFEKFSMKNGFRKGDIIIVWGRFTPKIGDIIIFKPNQGSTRPTPIIHRIIEINEDGTYQTKGDHNEAQLTKNLPPYVDELNIKKDQIIGKAIFKIPYLGWIKIWAMDLINAFR